MLQIARKEKAIDGDFYDLMYANPWSDKFDNNRLFTFLRKKDKDILLVVCNFSDHVADIDVNIPAHAMRTLSIAEKAYKAKDLLTGEQQTLQLQENGKVSITVQAYGARIWKL